MFTRHCEFCHFGNKKIENTTIDETENFIIKLALGSLVRGYILIISKKHYCSMAELNDLEIIEYKNLIQKYRNIFFNIYGKYLIVFEHGSISADGEGSSASIVHAHTHIVNHNFSDEDKVIDYLNLKKTDRILKGKNYIYYLSCKNEQFISYNFPNQSQLMRILIARDLEIEDKYDWRKDYFMENIKSTIEDIKNYL